jgi:hypothetical protein
MMRKLSVASITSSFAKRSGSVASVAKVEMEEGPTPLSGRDVENDDDGYDDERMAMDPKFPGDLAGLETLRHNPRVAYLRSRSASLATTFEKAEVTGSGWESGSIRHLESATLATRVGHEASGLAASSEALSVGLPALRMSSANSLPRLSRHTSTSSKRSPCSSDKENVYQSDGSGKDPPPSKPIRRSSSRWGRVTVLNREVVVQGIRSFFR